MNHAAASTVLEEIHRHAARFIYCAQRAKSLRVVASPSLSCQTSSKSELSLSRPQQECRPNTEKQHAAAPARDITLTLILDKNISSARLRDLLQATRRLVRSRRGGLGRGIS